MWDTGNVAHIARHGVTRDEVEQVCRSNPNVEQGYLGRLRFVGTTTAGRMIAVVLAPKGKGIYCVVTARPASRKERKQYTQVKGGEQAA